MRRKLPLIVAVIALVAIAVWLLFLRGGSKRPAAPSPDPKAQADDPWAKPRVKTPARDDTPPTAPIFLRDADPIGGLRLEGQVLDADDHPVGGAEVWLGSVPPRQAKTEDDGSFVFERLVGRAYELAARRGDDAGGPIAYTLTAASDPAVIRLRKGQTLAVIVTASADGKPIAGATVETRGLADQHATTGADGKAVLHAITPGWIALAVGAPGFAPRHVADAITDGQTELRVQLDRGAAVSGRVVDEQGAPIAKARVLAHEVATLVPLDDPDKDGAITDASGAFTLPAVAAGSYRFIATDDEHAPGASEPITVDGTSPRAGVTITMKGAAVLAGHVITKDRRPAPYATVKVSPNQAQTLGTEQLAASSRQVVADADGKFMLRGLPRAAMRVRAESDAAASPIADVDLAAAPKELELVLDVSGTIAGIVVDGDAQPVAEAEVSAMSDWMGGGGKIEDLAISGFAQATTDGGGRFTLHGLPDGAYRLWAHRAGGAQQGFDQQGTPAKTGDTAVKIVLAQPGGIRGKVAFDDGRAVAGGTVTTGFQTSAAIVGGAFELRDLAPGAYDLKLHGADFAEITRGDVKVEAGKVTDLGTITVKRGRRITGRVITSDGSPAPGAKVAIGKLLIADGKSLGINGLASDDQMGMRTTTTTGDGGFAMIGVGPDGGAILADHATLGRSDTLTVPPGTDDPPPITLRLHGFGSLGGRVTLGGQPVGAATMMVSPKSGGDASILVTTGADGTYLIEKIPEGQHHATVMRNQGLGAAMTSVDTTVVAGQRTTLDVDIPQGNITLTIEIRGKDGAKVDAAEVFLGGGTFAVHNGKELQAAVLHGAGTGGGGAKVWLGGPTFPSFEKLVPGTYTICTLPITGNIADPRIGNAIQAQAEKLDVYCVPYVMKPDPAQQRFVHEVPAMKPLPPN